MRSKEAGSYMKKLLVLLLLSPLAFAEDNKMIPLQKYFDAIDGMEDSQALYINYRCVALYGMLVDLFAKSPQEGSKEFVEKIDKSQKALVIQAEIYYNATTPKDVRNFQNNLVSSTTPMLENYIKEATGSWANTGDPVNDYISSDMKFCKKWIEALNSLY